jgi:hypothetical protein
VNVSEANAVLRVLRRLCGPDGHRECDDVAPSDAALRVDTSVLGVRLDCSSPTRAEVSQLAEVQDSFVDEGQVTPADHGATVGRAAPAVAGVPAAHQPGVASEETEATLNGVGTVGGTVPTPAHQCLEIADARDVFLPADVACVMHLPRSAEYVALHDTTFHLHEHPPR